MSLGAVLASASLWPSIRTPRLLRVATVRSDDSLVEVEQLHERLAPIFSDVKSSDCRKELSKISRLADGCLDLLGNNATSHCASSSLNVNAQQEATTDLDKWTPDSAAVRVTVTYAIATGQLDDKQKPT